MPSYFADGILSESEAAGRIAGGEPESAVQRGSERITRIARPPLFPRASARSDRWPGGEPRSRGARFGRAGDRVQGNCTSPDVGGFDRRPLLYFDNRAGRPSGQGNQGALVHADVAPTKAAASWTGTSDNSSPSVRPPAEASPMPTIGKPNARRLRRGRIHVGVPGGRVCLRDQRAGLRHHPSPRRACVAPWILGRRPDIAGFTGTKATISADGPLTEPSAIATYLRLKKRSEGCACRQAPPGGDTLAREKGRRVEQLTTRNTLRKWRALDSGSRPKGALSRNAPRIPIHSTRRFGARITGGRRNDCRSQRVELSARLWVPTRETSKSSDSTNRLRRGICDAP